MSKYIPGNQKHLTLNDRIYIENELSKGATFKDIAAFLCKDPTTISKEVRSRRLSEVPSVLRIPKLFHGPWKTLNFLPFSPQCT